MSSTSSSIEPKKEKVEQATSFKMNETKDGTMWVHNLYGLKNKVGFIEKPIIANKEQNYDWFFWGNKQEILNKPLQIIAENVENKQKVKLASISKLNEYNKPIYSIYKDYGIKQMSNKSEKTSAINTSENHNNSNPVAHYTIKINLPEKGLWKIYITLDGKTFSPIPVDVLEKSNGLKNMN